MTQTEYIVNLKVRHQELEHEIQRERGRPLPDGMLVQALKRQKLRIKDKIFQLTRP